jgi:hypothetical protein
MKKRLDPSPFQLDGLFVCRPCGRIYGDIVGVRPGTSRPGQRQHCDCTPASLPATSLRRPSAPEAESSLWPEYDFNEAVTLCRCCGGAVVAGGSRWSLWFCPACKPALAAVNRWCGTYVVPLGRFTLLDQIGRNEDRDREEPPFLGALGDWFQRVERLELHAQQVVQDRLRQLDDSSGGEVLLTQYLDRLPPSVELCQASVIDLLRAFQVPPYMILDAIREIER